MKKTFASLITFALVAATFIPNATANPGNKHTWLVMCPSLSEFYSYCVNGNGFCTPTACHVDVE